MHVRIVTTTFMHFPNQSDHAAESVQNALAIFFYQMPDIFSAESKHLNYFIYKYITCFWNV